MIKKKLIFSELDLQNELISFINEEIREKNSNSLSIYNMCYFNCLYLGTESEEKHKMYPDLLIFKNQKLSLIIELKYFRQGRIYNNNEIKNDFTKMKKILNCLNEELDEKNKIIGLEYVLDNEKDNFDSLIQLANEESVIVLDKSNININFNIAICYDYFPLHSQYFLRFNNVFNEVSKIRDRIENACD